MRYRWREFRLRYLPALVFALAVFAATFLWERETGATLRDSATPVPATAMPPEEKPESPGLGLS